MTTTKTSKMTEACQRHLEDISSLADLITSNAAGWMKDAEAKPKFWGIEGTMSHIRSKMIEAAAASMGLEPEQVAEHLAEVRDLNNLED